MPKSEKAKTKRCICGATMKFSTTNAQFRYAGTDIEIKNVKTYLCPCCGNEIIAPQESKKIRTCCQSVRALNKNNTNEGG